MGLFDRVLEAVYGDPKGTKEAEEKVVTKQKTVSPVTQKVIEKMVSSADAVQPYDPASVIPVNADIYQALRDRTTPGMDIQKANLADIANMINQPEAPLTGQDYTVQGLMGLNDILSGTKYVPELYAKKQGARDKKLKEKQMLAELYAQYTPEEVKYAKEQFQNLGSMTKDQSKAFQDAQKLALGAVSLGEKGGTETIASQEGAISNKPKDGPPKKGGGKGLKTLSEKTIKELADMDTQLEGAKSLHNSFKKLIAGKTKLQRGASALGGFNPFSTTDAELYERLKVTTTKSLASSLEGGRITSEDYKQYLAALPDWGDSDAQAQAKLNGLEDYVRTTKRNRIEGLREDYKIPSNLDKELQNVRRRTYKGKTLILKPGTDSSKKENWIEEK